MRQDQASSGALSQAAPYVPQEVSAASAAVGVFSVSNYWDRAAGAGVLPDLVPGSTIILMARVRANSGSQCYWGCCAAANGWHITASGSAGGRIDLFMRGGSNAFYPLNGGSAAPLGFFCVCVTRTAGGAFRSSINGLAVVQPSASPAYTALNGTSIETIGRVNPSVNTFPLVQGDVVAVAYINRAAADSEVQAWAGAITSTNLFELHPDVRANIAANPSTCYEMHFARDWDGAASTAIAGLGSATFTKHGTGGTKNILPAFRRYRFTEKAHMRNCDLLQTGIVGLPAGMYNGNNFASTKFTTTATHVIFDIDARNNGSINDADRFGIEIDGVADATAQLLWGFDVSQTYSRSGMSASSKVVECINGYHEFSPTGVGGTTKGGIGNTLIGVRVPVNDPPVFDLARPAARLLLIHNSMGGKVVGGNGALTGSAKQSYPMLTRHAVRTSTVPAWANGDVTADGWGGRNWHDVVKDAPTRAEWVARHVAALDGTTKNVVYACLDINDFILNPWGGDLVAFGTALGQYLDDFKTATDSASIPGFIFYLSTSQPKTDESPVDGVHTAQDFRDVVTALGNARSSWITMVQGPTMTAPGDIFSTPVGDLGDALHFHAGGAGAPQPTRGHVKMFTSLQAEIGF